jgi:POT family proton-dependent oligopeptide transporter
MMATWFLASSAAQALAAQVAKLTAQETVGGQVLDPQAALATYVDVFSQIGWAAIGIGAVLGAFSPLLKRLAHSDVVDTREAPPGKPVTES